MNNAIKLKEIKDIDKNIQRMNKNLLIKKIIVLL